MARPSPAICARLAERAEPLTADVVIVNTCSVTAEADRAARAFIRRTHRHNPAAQESSSPAATRSARLEELAAMPGVAAVVGNSHKALAPEIVFELGTAMRTRETAASADSFPWPVAVLCACAPQSGRASLGRRSLRPLLPRRSAARSRRADAPQPQDSGGMRQPLHLLRHSSDARLLHRSLPARGRPAPGRRDLSLPAATSWCFPASISAAGAATLPAAWTRLPCESGPRDLSSAPASPACASAPSSPWTGTTS